MMKIVVINIGSGSQKVVVYEMSAPLTVRPPASIWEGYVDWSEQPGVAVVHVTTAHGTIITQQHTATHDAMLEKLITLLWDGPAKVIDSPAEVAFVGHRIVHGGPTLTASVYVTPAVITALNAAASLASGHNEQSVQGIAIATRCFPTARQFVSFDTTFHAQLPLAAAVYPVPYAWYEQGIKRYGFHGLSYQYCSERAAQMLGGDAHMLRLIICHLGGGCSLAAVQGGQSVATTMGFTPLEGVMMNERSGTIDPGILLYLEQHRGYTAQQLDHDLHHASGLLGVSGISNDLRTLIEASSNKNQRAQLAVDMYVTRLAQGIGAMAAALGSVDALIFTGGVGEHLALIRSQTCQSLGFMGIQLDEARNDQATPDSDIARTDALIRILIIHTEEEWIVARDGWRLAH